MNDKELGTVIVGVESLMRHCRSKWSQKIDNVGDVILVIDPTTPRRLGKIEAVDPELDGNVRVVDDLMLKKDIKFANGRSSEYRLWSLRTELRIP